MSSKKSKNISITKLIDDNKVLLKNVFLTLIAQLFITFIVAYSLRYYPEITELLRNLGFMLFLFIFSLVILWFIANPTYSTSTRLIAFTVFSIIFGFFLSILNRVNPSILAGALGGTLSIFLIMFVSGIILTSYGYDLSLLGAFLFISLLMLIIVEVLSICFGISKTSRKVQLYIGLIIFSFYILYDTYEVVKQKDFVSGAVSYYLDLINIFLKLVQLMSMNK